MGWGGWDNNGPVPVHIQAPQQALLFHHQLLLGWGGVGWGDVDDDDDGGDDDDDGADDDDEEEKANDDVLGM